MALIIMLIGLAVNTNAAGLNSSEKLQILKSYKELSQGSAPEAPAKFDSNAVFSELQRLSMLVHNQKYENNNCQRFQRIEEQIFHDLMGAFAALQNRPEILASVSDYDFLFVNRLKILLSLFSQVTVLLKNGAEQGFSFLDLHTHQGCESPERATLVSFHLTLQEHLNLFFARSIGRPGINAMNEAEMRLIRLAVVEEENDNRRFWTIMGLGTGASLILWNYGPGLAAFAVRTLWGYTPRLLAVPFVLYGANVSALVAEGMAFSYADKMTSSKVIPPTMLLGSWEEVMNTVEIFLKNPLSSELQLTLLSRIHGAILAEIRPWLEQLMPFIEEEEKSFGTVDNAIAFYERSR